ncbi:hypothetical protein EB796_018840 [Bugula neritina]|uniref:G-protein coupled receptors family 1 profile domain-containing protein n=1 Tax=Bugula neritina TaxID=10212 RepID=A0A7J7JBW8_BUGNE|nr:hypothetical protein EB796_018840 [Bugula neritina]
MAKQWSHDNEVRQQELSRFYRHYTCQFRINKKNEFEPIFNILIGSVCVFLVIGIHVAMFFMLRSRLTKYSNMAENRKKQLRKAALTVLLVAVTFICTLLPFGITIQIAAFCDTNTTKKENIACNGLTLELRFVFSILAHLGNLLAPLLFTLLNKSIRRQLREFVTPRCSTLRKKNSLEKKATSAYLETTMVTSVSVISKKLSPDINKY